MPNVLGVSKMLTQVVDQLESLKETTEQQCQDAHLVYETTSVENKQRRDDLAYEVKELKEDLDSLDAELQLLKNEQAVSKVNHQKLEDHKRDTQEQINLLTDNYEDSEDDNKQKGQQMAELVETILHGEDILEQDSSMYDFLQTGSFLQRRSSDPMPEEDASAAAEAAAETEGLAAEDAAKELKARLQDPIVEMELDDDESGVSEAEIDALEVPDDSNIVSKSTNSTKPKKFMGSKKQWFALIDALHALATEPSFGPGGKEESHEEAKHAILSAVQASSTGDGDFDSINHSLDMAAGDIGINFSTGGSSTESILDMLKEIRTTLQASIMRLLQDQAELLKRFSTTKAAMDSVMQSTIAGIEQLTAELAQMKASIEAKNTQHGQLEHDHDTMNKELTQINKMIDDQTKDYQEYQAECTTIAETVDSALLKLQNLIGLHPTLRADLEMPTLFQQPLDKIKDAQTKDAFRAEDSDEMSSKLALGQSVATLSTKDATIDVSTDADPVSQQRFNLISEHSMEKPKPQSNLARNLAMLQAPVLDKWRAKVAMLQEEEKKKGFPSSDFNVKKAAQDIEQERASDFLKLEAKQLGSLGLGQLATRVAAEPFEKVKDLIQRLIDTLNAQKDEEVTKHTWCDEQTVTLETQLATKEMNVDEAQVRHDEASATFTSNKEGIDTMMTSLTDLATDELNAQKSYQDTKDRLTGELNDLAAVVRDLDEIIEDMMNTESDSLGGKLVPIIEVLKWTRNQLQNAHSDTEIHAREIEHEHETTLSQFRILEQQMNISLKEKETQEHFLESAMLSDKTSLEEHEALLEEAQKYHETLIRNCATPVESWEQRNERRVAEISALKEALEILEGHQSIDADSLEEEDDHDGAGDGDLVAGMN